MRTPPVLLVIFAVQLLCAAVFLTDIAITILGLPIGPINWQTRELIEIGAALGLVLGVILSLRTLRAAQRRSQRMEDQLKIASGAFMDLLEDRFNAWQLTPAERDVALFSIKGLNTAEIAAIRKTSEGTVKAQSNAIYRKSGVSGRPQLLSLFIEDLLEDTLLPAA